MQVNNWTGSSWNYPGNGLIGNSYEGWSDNGLTEISIPWTDLGNPSGLAISVHISAEDSQDIPEIFPGTNAAGNHPVINYFYALFEPFISGPMPLSGIEPNSIYIVPNTSPQITAYEPTVLDQTIKVDSIIDFNITVVDIENDMIAYVWKLDGIEVTYSDSYSYEPGVASIGNHTLLAIASDNVPGNVTDTIVWTIEVIESSISLNLTVFLEGPFNGINMNPDLNSNDFIPLSQPYYNLPWEYNGTEEVLAIPGIDIVDWIIVEIRDAISAETATESTSIAKQAAFVKADGQVIGIDGNSDIQFHTTINNNLYVAIWHRNHLGILSTNPLIESGGVYIYDFSSFASQVYGGALAHVQLSISPEIWGMIAGDADGNGDIQFPDIDDVWNNQAGNEGYLKSDMNLDTQSDNQDKNDFWLPNESMGSFIPE